MSYDIYLTIDTGGAYPFLVESWTPTYNFGEIFHQALGRPIQDLDGMTAADAAPMLWGAVKDLRERPELYKLYEKSAEWGSVGGARTILDTIAMACDAHPKTTFRAS